MTHEDHTLAASPGSASLPRYGGASGSAGSPSVTTAAVASFSVTTVDTSTLRSPSGVAVAQTVERYGGTGAIAIDTEQTSFDEDPGVAAAPSHSSAVSPSTASTESEDYEYELEEFNP